MDPDHPARHRRLCIEANKRAGGMLNRLIKAAKHWNHGQRDGSGDKPLRSFHQEVMCYEAFSTSPATKSVGCMPCSAFSRLAHPGPLATGRTTAARR
jgi:hypothetical protein